MPLCRCSLLYQVAKRLTQARAVPALVKGRLGYAGGIYAFVTGGAAVVALGGGLYFGHKSGSTISGLQGGYHPTAEIDAQSAAAKSDAGKATVLLAAGAILAVTTGVLFALRF